MIKTVPEKIKSNSKGNFLTRKRLFRKTIKEALDALEDAKTDKPTRRIVDVKHVNEALKSLNRKNKRRLEAQE